MNYILLVLVVLVATGTSSKSSEEERKAKRIQRLSNLNDRLEKLFQEFVVNTEEYKHGDESVRTQIIRRLPLFRETLEENEKEMEEMEYVYFSLMDNYSDETLRSILHQKIIRAANMVIKESNKTQDQMLHEDL